MEQWEVKSHLMNISKWGVSCRCRTDGLLVLFFNPACFCFTPRSTGWMGTVCWECVWLHFMANVFKWMWNTFNISRQHYFWSLPLMPCDSHTRAPWLTVLLHWQCLLFFCHYLSCMYIQIKTSQSKGLLWLRRAFSSTLRRGRESLQTNPGEVNHWIILLNLPDASQLQPVASHALWLDWCINQLCLSVHWSFVHT